MPWDDELSHDSPAHAIARDDASRIRVLAGPGTGKSFSMRRRVARLIEDGANPSRVLAVTFTRIAAEDIRRELSNLALPGAQRIDARTLHSLAMRTLQRQHVIDALGRNTRPLGEFEIEPLLCDLDRKYGKKPQRKKRVHAYEAAFARHQDQDPFEAADQVDRAFRNDLVDWLRFHRCMLLGELIPFFYRYLHDNPASPEFDGYDHILVDEYQDLNRVEQDVIGLLGRECNVIIVGDDNQSIYSFKHAHPEGIVEWELGNGNKSDHQLNICFRCPSRVVDIANHVIRCNPAGEALPLQPVPANGEGIVTIVQFWDANAEADGIVADVVQRIQSGTDPGSIIILTPRKKLGMRIADRLKEAGIPCREYLAESELKTPEVTERLSLLRLAADRNDRPALRWLLGYPQQNFRASQYVRLMTACDENKLEPWEALERCDADLLALPHCRSMLERFRAIRDTVDELVAEADSRRVLGRLFPEDDIRFDAIRELFVDELEEELELWELRNLIWEKIFEPNYPDEVEYVRVMTLFGSKGLGSSIVYVTSLIDGLLPRRPDGDETREEAARKEQEQRRLFYVALTRVKAAPEEGYPGELTISSFRSFSYADAYSLNNGSQNALASRFLGELGPMAPRPVRM